MSRKHTSFFSPFEEKNKELLVVNFPEQNTVMTSPKCWAYDWEIKNATGVWHVKKK